MASSFDNLVKEIRARLKGLENRTSNEPIGYDVTYTTFKYPGEYVYYSTFVVAFGESVTVDGRRPQLTRLWANGEEIFNSFTGNVKPGLKFDFFDGNEDQGPVYRDMNYRGLMCVLFRDMNLTDYGNSIPAITAEFYDAEGSIINTNWKKSFAYDGIAGTSLQLTPDMNRVHRAFPKDLTLGNPFIQTWTIPLWTVDVTTGAPIIKTGAFPAGSGSSIQAVFFPEIGYSIVHYNETISFGLTLSSFIEWDATSAMVAYRFNIENSLTTNETYGFMPVVAMGRIKLVRNGITRHFLVTFNMSSMVWAQPSYGLVEIGGNGRLTWAGHYGPISSHPGFDPFYKSSIVAGRVSENESVFYVHTSHDICKVTVSSYTSAGPYPSQVNHSPVIDFKVVPGGSRFDQVFYDVTNNRIIVIVLRPDNATSYAVAYNEDGTTAWTSVDFPRASTKIGYISGEATSDLSKGTLVLMRSATPTVLTRIDVNTGEVTPVAALSNVAPGHRLSVWDSRNNRLWLSDYSFIDVGASVATEDGSTPDFAGSTSAADLMRAFAAHVGYEDTNVFTVNLDHMPIYGYIVSNSDTLANLAGTIGGLYGFNWFTAGEQVTFKSIYDEDGALVVDLELTEDELAVLTGGSTDTVAAAITRGSDNNAPARSNFTYYDIDNEYKAGNVKASRGQKPLPTHASTAELDFTLPITMAAEQAQQLLYGMMTRAWAGKVAYSIRVPANGIRINPADVIKFESGAFSYTGVVTQPRVNADFSVSVSLTEAAGAVHPAKVEVQPPRVMPSTGAPARVIIFDIPDRDASNVTEDYYNLVAIAGAYDRDQFAGAVLEEVSVDDASQVKAMLAFDATEQGYIGSVVRAPGFWDRFDILDTYNDVIVKADNIPASKFVTATEAEMIDGANMIVIGSPTTAEILTFGNFEYLGDDTWRLYNLLRGRFGTDTMSAELSPNGNFAFLENFKTYQYRYELANESEEIRYRSRGPRQSAWQIATDRIVPVGNSRKPYSPVDIYAGQDGMGDIIFTWTRRARFINNPAEPFQPEPPLDEVDSRWRITIYNDLDYLTPIRTQEIEIFGSNDWNYTSFLQGLDGFIIGDLAYIQLQQYSIENDLYGFTHNYAVPIIPYGATVLSGRIGAGGTITGNMEVIAIPPVVGTIDGGGTMTAAITIPHELGAVIGAGGELTARMETGFPLGATISGGGSLSAEVFTPRYLSATMDAGGSLAAAVRLPSLLGGAIAGEGAMTANVDNAAQLTGVATFTQAADGPTSTSLSVIQVMLDTTLVDTIGLSLSGGSVIIPSGVNYIDIEAGVRITDKADLAGMAIMIWINGVNVALDTTRLNTAAGAGYANNCMITSADCIAVSAGDEIRLNFSKLSSVALGPIAASTYLSIRTSNV